MTVIKKLYVCRHVNIFVYVMFFLDKLVIFKCWPFCSIGPLPKNDVRATWPLCVNIIFCHESCKHLPDAVYITGCPSIPPFCVPPPGFSISVVEEDGVQQLYITDVKAGGLAFAKGGLTYYY